MKLAPLAAAVALLLWSGCDAVTYSPDDDPPFTELDPTPGRVSVDFTADDDTLGLWGSPELRYTTMAVDAGPIERVVVEVAGQTFEAGPAFQIAAGVPVYVQTDRIADGTYSLRLTAYSSSGTGSLAEVYGREPVAFTVERPVVIDNAPPQPVAVRSLGPEDGALTVRWKRYPRFNFGAYRVYRSDSEGFGRKLQAVITDRDSTSWADLGVVGGDIQYEIEVVAGDGRTATGPPKAQSFPTPSFTEATGEPSGRVTLTWTPTLFPAALDQYEVIQKIEGWNNTPLVTSTQNTTASFMRPGNFGAIYRFELITRSLGGEAAGTLRSEETAVALDAPSGLTGDVSAVPGRGAVYAIETASGQPVLLDATSLAVRARASISAGGSVFAVASLGGRLGAIYRRSGRTYGALLDPSTLAVQHEIPLEPFLGEGAQPDLNELGTPQLTDDGVLFFGANPTSFSTYDGPTLVGVDLRTGQSVATFGSRGMGPLAALAVSPDGQFLVIGIGAQEGIYERSPSVAAGYRRISAAGGGPSIVTATFISPSRLALVQIGGGPTEVRVIDLPSLAEVWAVEFPRINSSDLFYDPVSAQLALVTDQSGEGGSRSNIYLFDPATGSVRQTIPSVLLQFSHSFAAGTLWGEGRYRPIP